MLLRNRKERRIVAQIEGRVGVDSVFNFIINRPAGASTISNIQQLISLENFTVILQYFNASTHQVALHSRNNMW